MKSNIRLVILSVLLLLSIFNCARIAGMESIRLIQFLSIFSLGLLTGLLIREVAEKLRKKDA